MTDRAPPLTPEELARLEHDLPCVVCQYNLKHQPPTGVCPECGTAVERSVRIARLTHGPPAAIARLLMGAWLLTISTLLSVVYWGLDVIGWMSQLSSIAAPLVRHIVYLLDSLTFIAGAIFIFIAGTDALVPRQRRRRQLLWVVAIFFTIASLTLFATMTALADLSEPSQDVLYVVASLLDAGLAFLTITQQKRLATQIPAPDLSAAFGWLRWLYVCVVAICVGMSVVPAMREPGIIANAAIVVAWIALIVEAIYLLFNWRFCQSLTRVLREK